MDLREAIRLYRSWSSEKDISFITMAARIANGTELSPDEKDLISTLENGIEKSIPFEEERVFYRGMSKNFLPEIQEKEFIYKPLLSVSEITIDTTGFLNEENPILLKVIAPKGCKALFISEEGSNEKREHLFKRGLKVKISYSFKRDTPSIDVTDFVSHNILKATMTII